CAQDLLDSSLPAIDVRVTDGDGRARSCHVEGDGPPDTCRPACQEHYPVVQGGHQSLPPRPLCELALLPANTEPQTNCASKSYRNPVGLAGWGGLPRCCGSPGRRQDRKCARASPARSATWPGGRRPKFQFWSYPRNGSLRE